MNANAIQNNQNNHNSLSNRPSSAPLRSPRRVSPSPVTRGNNTIQIQQQTQPQTASFGPLKPAFSASDPAAFSDAISTASSLFSDNLPTTDNSVGITKLAAELSHVGMHTRLIKSTDEVFNAHDPNIKQDIIRIIAQYLGDEGYHSAKVTLLDEANVKSSEREEQAMDIKRIKKSVLGSFIQSPHLTKRKIKVESGKYCRQYLKCVTKRNGDWPEVDRLLLKPLIKNQKSFLWALYKQQYLEYIEYQELQKAFTHLTKRLKPLENYQTSPQEFKDLCYLLTSKSVQSVPSFKNWEGIGPSREKLVEQFQTMLDSDTTSKQNAGTFIPPHRLLTLLRQAVSYQVEFSRYHPRVAPKISTLLQNFQSVVIPNAVHKTYTGHQGNVKCAEFVGELGNQIISGSSDNTCRLWNTDSGRCVGILEGHEATVWAVTSNKPGTFVASASGDGTVKIWDVAKKECSQTLKASNADLYSVEYHPNNVSNLLKFLYRFAYPCIYFAIAQKNHVVSGGYDSTIRLFDIERGVIVKTFTGHTLSTTSTIFSSIGNLIISASKDATIKFWDIISGICIKTIASHLGEVTSVDISATGTQLLSSSKDNSNRLWDMRMMQSVRRFKGHQNTSKNFIRASFAGDSLVVGGSEDSMVHVWDADKGTLISRLSGHGGIAYSAVWNANQSLFCSSSDDRTLKTWWFDAAKPVVSQY
ncbi:hypothetical protein HK100_000435 [Physocladia obscura]|uniref:WD40 repeat-containing protein SMU1 n=1 Tax=Physocladia obscura TaxID=109957 RepID=A0AAD5T074_9FUNG|nr:hypothetical protein HK100_000435 [Physocladia obscura]